MSLVRQVNAESVTILLIEHDECCYELMFTNCCAQFRSKNCRRNSARDCLQQKVKAYLGEDSRYATQS